MNQMVIMSRLILDMTRLMVVKLRMLKRLTRMKKTMMLLRNSTKSLISTLRELRECLMRCLAIASCQRQNSVQSRPSMRRNARWGTFCKLSQFRNSSRKSFSMMIWLEKWRQSSSLESKKRGMSFKE